ncbi:MAG: type I CRISPR-associated protein Cas7, partial [Thermodesulfobacteriota bacterium]|nr:type I CRISPR-associated protein Cas7 [Thermodesulfobacteriota bacterium]
MSLENKIDFAIIFSVKNANPNGDPLNGNRPRIDYDGYGEVSDVCLKRKIRDRLQEGGHAMFVQSDEKKIDGMFSLKNRAESDEYGLGKDAFNRKKISPEKTSELACKKWLDVRTFG